MRDRVSLLLLASASAAVVCAPLGTSAWVGGHEGANYLYRTAEFTAQMAHGEPWPRWMPDFYWGYGYPFFVFYPPGLFWLSALLSTVAGVAGGLKLTVLLGCFSTFFGMRHLLQPYCSEHSARLGAVVATVFQWHFVQVYVRGDLAETFTTSLLPWVFAAVLRDRPLRLAAWLGAAALCHTLTAVMACWCVLLLGSYKLLRRDTPGFLRTAGGGALGLTIAAGYLLPAWAERPNVQTERMVQSVDGVFSFHWSDHFVGLSQRWSPTFRWGTSVEGTGDLMPLGDPPWAWIIVAAAGVLAVRDAGARRRLGPWLLAWFAIGATVTAVSTPLWKVLPLFEFFQFPWRWMLLQGIVVGGLAALAAEELEVRKLTRFAGLLGVLGLLGVGLQALHVEVGVAGTVGFAALAVVLLAALGALIVEGGQGRPIARVAATVTLVAAMPLMLAVFHKAATTPTPIAPSHLAALEEPALLQRLDLIDSAGYRLPIVTDGVDAYRPDTVTIPPGGPPGTDRGPRPDYGLGPPAEQHGAWRRWYVDQPAEGMREATWFVYPGVRASIDGSEVEIGHDGHGLVQVEVPAGPHVVDVWYEGTRAQTLGAGVSAAGLLVLGLLAFRERRGRPAAQ